MIKKKRGKLSGIAVACLLVASLVVAGVIAPATILASPDPSVSIVPQTQEAAAGGTFSVDVMVDSDDIPIKACNVTVFFDPDLAASGLVGADLLGTAGLDALYIPSIDVGEAGYAGARLPAAGAIAVNGNFVTINFDVGWAAAGTYPLIVEAQLLDAGGEGLTVILNDGEVVVPGGPPGDASVSIIPDTQPAVAGGTFSVGVEVDSAGIPITACNVMVFFNDDLTATGLVGANLLGVEGIDALYLPSIDVGEAGYAGVRIDGPIAVNGNFVTINFDVDWAAAGTYDLVVGATLLDAGGIPIAVVENDGEVVVGGGPGAASVSIDPAWQMVEAGGMFSVDVVVDSAGIPLTACDVAVFFDTDLTAIGLVGRDLLGVEGIDALYIPDIEAGEVSYAGARIDGPIAVNGDFVTIDFEVDLAATGTYVLWVEAMLLDAGGNPIAVVENDGEIEIGLPIYDETFVGSLPEGWRAYLCTIPAGATELDITMTTAASPGPDMDLELYDGATKVIGEYGWIDSPPGGWYEGDYFGYSGYYPSPDPGNEYIDSLGPLERNYDLEVYAYEAGTYTVHVFYVMPGPDPDPPVIDIYAPDGTVGVPSTITVSATDPSGVAWIWFGVWPDWYVLTGTEADWFEAIIWTSGPGSEVSVTCIPTADLVGGYYVAAWACDMVGNCTPELDPATAPWWVL